MVSHGESITVTEIVLPYSIQKTRSLGTPTRCVSNIIRIEYKVIRILKLIILLNNFFPKKNKINSENYEINI
jgi:hypothetical protein